MWPIQIFNKMPSATSQIAMALFTSCTLGCVNFFHQIKFADKGFVGDFNIIMIMKKNALGLAFVHIFNSFKVRQHVSGPTHSCNRSSDFMLSYGIDVDDIEGAFAAE